jgi:hypothetical protein
VNPRLLIFIKKMHFKRLLIFFCFQGLCLFFWGVLNAAPPVEEEPGVGGLNLTIEQRRLLKDLRESFRQEEKEIRRNVMQQKMELRTLSQEEFRGEKGENLRRQLQSLMLQARERALYYHQQALAILTTEQKKKLPPDADLGFHCRGWFGGGRGPGMGMGRGRGMGTGNSQGLGSPD